MRLTFEVKTMARVYDTTELMESLGFTSTQVGVIRKSFENQIKKQLLRKLRNRTNTQETRAEIYRIVHELQFKLNKALLAGYRPRT